MEHLKKQEQETPPHLVIIWMKDITETIKAITM